MEKLSKEKIDQLIDSIEINAANLEHIAKSGRKINGTLRVELWRVILEAWAIGAGDSEKSDQDLLNFINSEAKVKDMIIQLKSTFENLRSTISTKTAENA